MNTISIIEGEKKWTTEVTTEYGIFIGNADDQAGAERKAYSFLSTFAQSGLYEWKYYDRIKKSKTPVLVDRRSTYHHETKKN